MYKLESTETEGEIEIQEYYMVQVGNNWTMPPLSSSGRPCDNLTNDFRHAICYREKQKCDLFEPRYSINKAYRDAKKFGGKVVRATLKFEVTDETDR